MKKTADNKKASAFRVAGAFAGDDVPNMGHLQAAIFDLKLAPKGAV